MQEVQVVQAVQMVSAVALLAVTAVLTRATWKMSRSTDVLAEVTRKAHEDSKRPKVTVKLKPYAENGQFIQLVLTNLGQGTAFNVNFHLGGDPEILTKQGVVLRGTVAPISFMASGESEEYPMGSVRTLFEKPLLPPFPVEVAYADVDGKKYSEKITLDVKHFELLQWQGSSVAWRQMEAMEAIAKKLTAKQLTAPLTIPRPPSFG